jgi:hypothetical protein
MRMLLATSEKHSTRHSRCEFTPKPIVHVIAFAYMVDNTGDNPFKFTPEVVGTLSRCRKCNPPIPDLKRSRPIFEELGWFRLGNESRHFIKEWPL